MDKDDFVTKTNSESQLGFPRPAVTVGSAVLAGALFYGALKPTELYVIFPSDGHAHLSEVTSSTSAFRGRS